MPRPRNEVPSYRPHAPRNCGKVVVADEVVYFPGRYKSPESLAAYRKWLANYLDTGQVHPHKAPPEVTVGELVLAFDQKVVGPRFRRDGCESGEARSFRCVMRALLALYVDTPAADFTPRDLKAVRQTLVDAGYTRKRVNQHVQRIRRVFRWGVAEGKVPETVWRALNALEGLRHGEAKREGRKIPPVSEAAVAAIESQVTPTIWTMIQLQLWTGARPGEILLMRTCDILVDDPSIPQQVRDLCWSYYPSRHKTEHHGKERTILLGPQARALLEPWLRPDEPDAYLFSPAESRRKYLAKRSAESRTHKRNFCRKANPKRQPKDHYTVLSYRQSISRACERAFGMPMELRRIKAKRSDGTPVPAEELAALRKRAAEWRAKHCWHPHQLRHTAATRIRAAYGIEVARIILGHSNIATTEIYAEADLAKAAQAIAAMG